jgi:hypothetical protein
MWLVCVCVPMVPPIITLQVHSDNAHTTAIYWVFRDVLPKFQECVLQEIRSKKCPLNNRSTHTCHEHVKYCLYVIKNKNFGSTPCMCRAHIPMAGVVNIAISLTNQNVAKFEHEKKTQYKNTRAILKVTFVYFRQPVYEQGSARPCEVASHDQLLRKPSHN